MLIKYIRVPNTDNSGRGTPIGCIVALDKNRIGYSFCNPKDRFDRKLGRELAAGRAALGTATNIPNRFIDGDFNGNFIWESTYLEDHLDEELSEMKYRAERYFK